MPVSVTRSLSSFVEWLAAHSACHSDSIWKVVLSPLRVVPGWHVGAVCCQSGTAAAALALGAGPRPAPSLVILSHKPRRHRAVQYIVRRLFLRRQTLRRRFGTRWLVRLSRHGCRFVASAGPDGVRVLQMRMMGRTSSTSARKVRKLWLMRLICSACRPPSAGSSM